MSLGKHCTASSQAFSPSLHPSLPPPAGVLLDPFWQEKDIPVEQGAAVPLSPKEAQAITPVAVVWGAVSVRV